MVAVSLRQGQQTHGMERQRLRRPTPAEPANALLLPEEEWRFSSPPVFGGVSVLYVDGVVRSRWWERLHRLERQSRPRPKNLRCDRPAHQPSHRRAKVGLSKKLPAESEPRAIATGFSLPTGRVTVISTFFSEKNIKYSDKSPEFSGGYGHTGIVDHLLDDRINISPRLRRCTNAQRHRQQGEKQNCCERILKHYMHLYPIFLKDRGI